MYPMPRRRACGTNVPVRERTGLLVSGAAMLAAEGIGFEEGCYETPDFFSPCRALSGVTGPRTMSRTVPCASMKNVAGGPKMR